jgi:hypothetical protein
MNFLFGQSWDCFLYESSDLLLAFLLLGYTNVLLLQTLVEQEYERTITAINMLRKTSGLSVSSLMGYTIASNEPGDQEGCRHPSHMILRLITRRGVQDDGPILRTQNLVHPKERVPDGTKRHFILIPSIRIDRRNIPPNQLTTKNAHQKGKTEDEEDQVQQTVDIAQHFFLLC